MLYEKIEDLIVDHGLVVITGSNQNRTLLASFEVLNVLGRRYPRDIEKNYMVTIGDPDQYNDDADCFRKVDIDQINAHMLVYAGAIRSLEKANLVLKAAHICPVIAVMHVNSAYERFQEMGCDLQDVHLRLKVEINTEN